MLVLTALLPLLITPTAAVNCKPSTNTTYLAEQLEQELVEEHHFSFYTLPAYRNLLDLRGLLIGQ